MIKGQRKVRGIRGPVSSGQFVARIGQTPGHAEPVTPAVAKRLLSVLVAEIPYDNSTGNTGGTVQDAIDANTSKSSQFDLVIVDAEGTLTAGERLPFFVATRAMTIPASLSGATSYANTAPTADATFTIKKNGSSVATITFAAGSHTATFTAASAISLAAGDRLEPFAPSSADTTLSDVSITLQGTK